MKTSHALAMGFAILAFASASQAQTHLHVPGQYTQINAAIQAATPGSIIEVLAQGGPYQPFVVDRPVSIVGLGGQDQEPAVAVASGAGVTFQLAPGEHASIARIDFHPVGSSQVTGAVVTGGMVSFEECRFQVFAGPPGATMPAVFEVTDADLTLTNCLMEGNTFTVGLRAVRSRVHALRSRFFGGQGSTGFEATDTELNATSSWFEGGDALTGLPGGAGIVLNGNSRAWLVDAQAHGGIGTPGGNAVINNTTNPVETLNGTFYGGLDFPTAPSRAATFVGAQQNSPSLLGLAFNEDLYRTGTLHPGGQYSMHVMTTPSALAFLAFELGPTNTASLYTRQPAMLPNEITFVVAVVGSATGYATFSGTLPNLPSIIGTGVWVQGVGGSALPFEATPLAGFVVR